MGGHVEPTREGTAVGGITGAGDGIETITSHGSARVADDVGNGVRGIGDLSVAW
jgi:hypothetical protein